jgi:hypothetical protein
MSSQTTGGFQPAVLSITGTRTTGQAYDGLTFTASFPGSGYAVNDVITIPGTFFKGVTSTGVAFAGTSPTNDLTLTVASLTGTGIATFSTAVGNAPTVSGGNISFVTPIDLEFTNVKAKYTTVLRDSSDYTRQLKERLVYNEFKNQVNNAKQDRRGGISSAGPGSAGTLDLQQSNQFRLSYLFGKRNCGNCAGGWFNTNGVRNFNSSGVQSGT